MRRTGSVLPEKVLVHYLKLSACIAARSGLHFSHACNIGLTFSRSHGVGVKTKRQAGIFLLLLSLSGCTSTTFQVTSDPPGTRVSLRQSPDLVGIPTAKGPPWTPIGTTPCEVVLQPTLLDASGPSPALLVSLSTNQHKIVELHPLPASSNVLGPALIFSGFPAAVLIGLGGGDLVLAGVVGVGLIGGGIKCLINNARNPGRHQAIHVDFTGGEQKTNHAARVPGAESAPPPVP
jgi:hypothetical protein